MVSKDSIPARTKHFIFQHQSETLCVLEYFVSHTPLFFLGFHNAFYNAVTHFHFGAALIFVFLHCFTKLFVFGSVMCTCKLPITLTQPIFENQRLHVHTRQFIAQLYCIVQISISIFDYVVGDVRDNNFEKLLLCF